MTGAQTSCATPLSALAGADQKNADGEGSELAKLHACSTWGDMGQDTYLPRVIANNSHLLKIVPKATTALSVTLVGPARLAKGKEVLVRVFDLDRLVMHP